VRVARVFASRTDEVLRTKRLLVYDLETYATGFADPNWVPQVVTCVAWKWLGEPKRKTYVSASTDFRDPECPMPHLDPAAIHSMMVPFLVALEQATAVVTYNGLRFDNPVLNGTMWLTGQRPIGPISTYDLHDFGRTKGVKKGLDNTAVKLGAATEKLSLNHAQWQEGYLEPGWGTIKARAKSDVVLTEQVFDLKKELGWLKPPKLWKP
jgi:hypothetical protein